MKKIEWFLEAWVESMLYMEDGLSFAFAWVIMAALQLEIFWLYLILKHF